MTAGSLVILSVDILYAVLAGSVFRGLALLTVGLVGVQSIGIILYYQDVFFLRPYSSDFSAWLLSVLAGRRERQEQGRSSLGPTALLAAFSFALAVLLVVAILSPGRTLDQILPVGELRSVAYRFYLLVRLSSQLVIMLTLHSWLSRSIARPVLSSSDRGLAREVRALRLPTRTRSPRRLRRIDRAFSLLAETRLYRVQPIRIAGVFPPFLLGSDHLVLLSLRECGAWARGSDCRGG